ncbi:glycosyltransferase family A protein [Nocardia donostiensis]|uniref:Glycosyl transferase n=1 Tax=Nocardia donostiensis TaxID=1538463 RepID=A0A1V2TH05_9NOCA|nr:glycosyltransferase family A protein [Nocardia donostiensis]ONM48792.1 glycosyl transferase [Nocardia donostiensis]OQS18210.1 glycosyl transferase [Nocardia donostiensis]
MSAPRTGNGGTRHNPARRPPRTPEVDVLIPTRNRPLELATTLAGLAAQDFPDFGVVVSDQSDSDESFATAPARSMVRVLTRRGHPVRLGTHRPPRGMAEHRCHLLARSRARYVLFLDDDVWLESDTITRLHTAISELGCGLVGCAVQGLSYLDDYRPEELRPFEVWPGRPQPERIVRGEPAWERWMLHNAANPTHLGDATGASGGDWVAYKVAWIGGCVLFDRAALIQTGGFDFWTELPAAHCGEDVLAQLRVLARYGGAGILPSGAVHLESPTTISDRRVEAFDAVPPDFWPTPQNQDSASSRRA